MLAGSFRSRAVVVLLALAAMLPSAQAAEPAATDPPRFVKPLDVRKFDPTELSWPLTFSRDVDMQLSAYAKTTAARINCQWRNPSDKNDFRSMALWKGRRPDLSVAADAESMEFVSSRMSADVAVDQCPATWGEAVTLVWGPTAVQQMQASAAGFAKRQDELKASGETEEQRSAREARLAWQAAAKAQPPLSTAQESELVQKVEADLRRMEDNIDGLNSKPFDTALKGELGDRMVRLMQVAYVKSAGLSADGAGRTAFDAWDNKLGGPALMAIVRVEKIIYYRMHRRFKLAEVKTANDAMREMESWSYVDLKRFTHGREFLMGFMVEKLAGKQLVDPAFLKKIASDLARDRPSGDPGRPYYRYVPAEKKPSWMMSPAEQEAEEGGKMVQGAVDLVMQVGNMIRLIEKVDADARESRVAFWRCYATRCNEAGKVFYAYSSALNAKDQWLIFRPVMTPGLLAPGMSMLGDTNVDGGFVGGVCGAEMDAISKALSTPKPLGQMDSIGHAKLVMSALKGPAYAAWQTCRDRAEYISRPRNL